MAGQIKRVNTKSVHIAKTWKTSFNSNQFSSYFKDFKIKGQNLFLKLKLHNNNILIIFNKEFEKEFFFQSLWKYKQLDYELLAA